MNNPIFGNYARYYNLLYRDKDYAAEARYIHGLIEKFCPDAKPVLNLGCGTGNHDFELAKFGYEITGVDMSEDMLAAANSGLSSPTSQSSSGSCSFLLGDIRSIRLNKTFDVVISLFHVMSYQITNDDLQAAITTAKVHLSHGGFFIFDCWYGPAVISNPPVVRVKRFEDEVINVLRIAEPVMHPNDNVVDVNYQVMITDKCTGKVEQLMETHQMRYLFIPELAMFLRDAGLSIISVSEWMTGNIPDRSTWGVCFVVKG
jgi:SAM-dependent methyltransferase